MSLVLIKGATALLENVLLSLIRVKDENALLETILLSLVRIMGKTVPLSQIITNWFGSSTDFKRKEQSCFVFMLNKPYFELFYLCAQIKLSSLITALSTMV